jgi:arylsulfatase A
VNDPAGRSRKNSSQHGASDSFFLARAGTVSQYPHIMNKRFAFALLCAVLVAFPAAAGSKTNFILILADDLGWADLGSYGSEFHETPNLDRLAEQGMRFTDAYSSCTVCSPTRASLLTGKYPATLRITDWIAGHQYPFARLQVPDWTQALPEEENTLAEALKAAGYVTGVVGKWHLGENNPPEKHGFDFVKADWRGSPPRYIAPFGIPAFEDAAAGEFLTDRECSEALRFIEMNRDRPFFLYLPHYAVHTPIQGKPEVIEKYKAKAEAGNHHPVYAALLESLDDSVGRILARLDELRLSERTVVIFTSDNGGLARFTSNAPLREGKGSAYEGGVRVPLMVRWPGVVPPGSVSSAPVISTDFYPTLLEMAGAPAQGPVEGESFLPVLAGTGSMKRTDLFWHYPHYHPGGATPYGAVRDGDWKLIQYYEDGRLELYNLKEDIGETTNLAGAMEQRAMQLQRKLDAWRRAVGAQMPLPNPNHDPARADARPGRR